jgi:chromate transporter
MATPSPSAGPSVTLAALFLGFLRVAASGFGGTLPWARRMLVEERRWLGQAEFTEVLGLCQFLPGPNVVNVAICVGARFRGGVGAAVAFAGLVILPFTVVLALAALYARYGQLAFVRGALAGISAVAAGLVVAMGLQMAAPLVRNPRAVAFGLLAFVAVGVLRWPLVWVVVALVPLSIATASRRR